MTAAGRRADLLALTPDALAELTNRGLVKRAAKTVEEGAGPAVSVLDDGAVRGVFPDAVETTVPVGGLAAARCGCGATGVCRHVLAVVLAYQAGRAPDAPGDAGAGGTTSAVEDWAPGSFTDEDLARVLGARMLATARRRLREGFLARVHRADVDDPVPHVELPACTVRFLVPHDLGYARSDAGSGSGPEIALAVWAWRAYQEAGSPEGHFAVGGGGPAAESGKAGKTGKAAADVPDSPDASGAAGSSADSAGAIHSAGPAGSAASAATRVSEALNLSAALARDVLLTGVSHLGSGFGPALARVRRDLGAAGLRWPLLAAEDLAEQIDAYRARSAVHQSERVADLLAELVARRRAAAWAGGSPRARVLGLEEAAETALRLIRLTGLGCRVEAFGDERRVRVFFAESTIGVVLTLHHRWAPESKPADGPGLASRRLVGTTLGGLAAGTVVTESARRGADRRLWLATGRIGRTTVSPASSGAWDALPQRLLLRDLAAAAAEFENLPPRLVRPRIEAEDVRVAEIGEVQGIGYRPGAQRLEALVSGASGGTATVVAEYRAVAPGALDALARALADGPRFVSGTVRRGRGGLEITPLALATPGGVVVPELAAPECSELAGVSWPERPDETGAALETARGLLAEVAHRGARQLPPSFGERLEAAARALDRAGLARCGTDLRELARTLGPAPDEGTFAAWTAATVRVVTTIEAR